jgi:hypothetical protein
MKASPSDSSNNCLASFSEICVSPRNNRALKFKIASIPTKEGFESPALKFSLTLDLLLFHQFGILHKIPDSSKTGISFRNENASFEVQARG